MKRRELLRGSILTVLGATVVPKTGLAREFPEDYDASKELARADWKAEFLDAHQMETLTVLGDLIIPQTDTPGANAALCHRFIDHVLAAETPEEQKRFLNSLAFFDGEAIRRYGKAFVYLATEQQLEELNSVAYPHSLETWGENKDNDPDHAHFEVVKGWVSRAYWNSEIGLKTLGWDGTFPHGEEKACGAGNSEQGHGKH